MLAAASPHLLSALDSGACGVRHRQAGNRRRARADRFRRVPYGAGRRLCPLRSAYMGAAGYVMNRHAAATLLRVTHASRSRSIGSCLPTPISPVTALSCFRPCLASLRKRNICAGSRWRKSCAAISRPASPAPRRRASYCAKRRGRFSNWAPRWRAYGCGARRRDSAGAASASSRITRGASASCGASWPCAVAGRGSGRRADSVPSA